MPHKGYKHTFEAKQKMGLARLGKAPWNKGLTVQDLRVAQTIRNLTEHNKGRPSWNKGKPSPKVKINLSPSRDLAYVLGVLVGDGWTTVSTESGVYRVGLHCLSKGFASTFHHALERLGFHPQTFTYFNNGYGQKMMYRVKAESRIFVEWYRQLSLDDIYGLVLNYGNDFLRGFFDSEGYFGQRSIWISNTNLPLCRLIQRVADVAGFNLHLHEYPYSQRRSGIEYRLDLHGGKSEIKRFIHEVLGQAV